MDLPSIHLVTKSYYQTGVRRSLGNRWRRWCRLWQSVQADPQPKSSGLVLGWQPIGAVLHSSNEPGELSHVMCNAICRRDTER